MPRELMIVVGTRPEIIKMAPIIKALQSKAIPFVLTHCGQHYDFEMSHQFFKELGLPNPDRILKVPKNQSTVPMAEMLAFLYKTMKKIDPAVVLVEGDTNGVLASALAAIQLGIPVGHVEAGLRSYDFRMIEEHNRRITDHFSTELFAPTKNAQRNLEDENVWGTIHVTGNTVIDAVQEFTPIAQKKSRILESINFSDYGLMTLHRAENVDNYTVLRDIIEAVSESPLPFVFPIHPRTESRLKRWEMAGDLQACKNIQILPPLCYLDTLRILKDCRVILTDSGGIQEEATAPVIRKPILVTRISTERPEAVTEGFAEVVGVKKEGILNAIKRFLNEQRKLPNHSPYGNGKSAMEIVGVLDQNFC